MFANVWIALALGAAVMVGGAAVVAAAGIMNGDCDQLKDGTGEDCQDDTADDGVCDSCEDYDWEFLYGETELEPPHQSTCGQE